MTFDKPVLKKHGTWKWSHWKTWPLKKYVSLSLSCPSQDRMVTRMQLAYNLLPPVQRCSSSRHTCAAEIQLVPILAKHHKLPTHLQFYCIFKSVELSWAQFDYIVCEGSWWFHTEIRTLNSRIRVQVSNPSTNNDMWKKELIFMPYILL